MKVRSAEFVISAAKMSGMPLDGRPEVAVIGRSNVGKSSLINALLGRKSLARTSTAPGKTQTVNFFLVNDTFYLVDLPGLGYAKVSKRQRAEWRRLIAGYIERRETLSVVVHLVDSRHEPTAIDRAVTEIIRDAGCGYVVALTKTDKLNQSGRAKIKKRMENVLESEGIEPPVVETSAVKRTGIVELWRWIEMLG